MQQTTGCRAQEGLELTAVANRSSSEIERMRPGLGPCRALPELFCRDGNDAAPGIGLGKQPGFSVTGRHDGSVS